jgi:hypothetical protein
VGLAGWSAGGDLLFYARRARLDGGPYGVLWQWPPGEAEPRPLLDVSLDGYWGSLMPQWAAGRTLLGVTLVDDQVAPSLRPALLRLNEAAELSPLTSGFGYGTALVPDASAAAYIAPLATPSGAAHFGVSITWRSLEPGALPETGMLSAADLAVDGAPPTSANLLHWSPDGRWLAFLTSGAAYGTRLFVFDRATQALTHITGSRAHFLLPLRFSADSRYLAYLENVGTEPFLWWIVRDLATGYETRRAYDFGHLRRIQTGLQGPVVTGVAAWSPAGHLLAVSSPSGIFVHDPATGDRRWLTLEPCGRVVWW